MKNTITILIIIFLSPVSHAETICFEPRNKPDEIQLVKPEKVCIDIGDHSEPVVIGGNGGCGGSSACGGNSQEVPKILLDHSKDLQLIIKDYKVNIQQNIQR